jgi:hypothetical protein
MSQALALQRAILYLRDAESGRLRGRSGIGDKGMVPAGYIGIALQPAASPPERAPQAHRTLFIGRPRSLKNRLIDFATAPPSSLACQLRVATVGCRRTYMFRRPSWWGAALTAAQVFGESPTVRQPPPSM